MMSETKITQADIDAAVLQSRTNFWRSPDPTISRERQIEMIRDEIRDNRGQRDEDRLITAKDALEWVLRAIFEVTP